MDNYLRTEILTDYRCDVCDVLRPTSKTLIIVKAPLVLVVHLSRFNNGLQKIPNYVGFPRNFTIKVLKDGIEEQIFYEFTGVIIHVGQTIAAGHYFTYVFADGNWLKANDSVLTEDCWESVRKKQAYMLFYKQV